MALASVVNETAGRDAGLADKMLRIARSARVVASKLALAAPEAKNGALLTMAAMLRNFSQQILDANKQDVEAARQAGRPSAFVDRLTLNEQRIEAMAKGA